MGNFSRDTFDQTKNYVAVRLEQGVPLVDADWNELEDVTRHEIYDGLWTVAPNVASRGGLDLSVVGPNDITVSPGRAIAGGRPIRLWAPLQYSTQRYANAGNAAADGVPQVLPMTTPGLFRTDCVYLDAFEREVTSVEDPTLINGAIGLETSTRLKREVALRVVQGAASPPAPAAGHTHFRIALIRRIPTPILAGQIEDVKPYPLPLGEREVAFAPALQATGGGPAFTIEAGPFPYRTIARKQSGALTAFGVMQLPHIPDGARLTRFRVRGLNPGVMSWQFVRAPLDGSLPTIVLNDAVFTGGPFDRLLPVPPAEPLVDNSLFFYHFAMYQSSMPNVGEFHGGTIRYVP